MAIARTYPSESVRLAFDELTSYLSTVAEQLEVAATKEREWVLDNYAGDDGPDDVALDWAEIQEQYDLVFGKLLVQSVVVLTYSQMEYHFRRLCALLKTDKALPTSLGAFKGDIVERTQAFFTTFGLTALSTDELRELDEFTLVRNCVVHNAGVVSGIQREQALRNVVKNGLDHLKIDEHDQIAPSLVYCHGVVLFLSQLFERLYLANGYEVASRRAPNKPLQPTSGGTE